MLPDIVRKQQSILHTHRILMRAGLSLVSSFAWVFVFEAALAYSNNIPDSFLVALLLYALSQSVIILATPLSAAHLRHGMKRMMLFGVLFAALGFAVLGATLAGDLSIPLGWGIVLFGILLGAYRALYWIPYRLQTAGPSGEPHALFEILLALLPAFAGLTLITIGDPVLRLFFGAAALLVVSIAPLLFLHDIAEPFEWGYLETFATLFDRRYRTLALRATLSGIESATLFILWPLSVFLIVGGSYFTFGLVMSVSLLILLAGRGLYRRFFREGPLAGSMPVDVAFAMSGWLLRLAAGSPVGIVFADSYSYVSAPSGAPEFFAREHSADGGSYIDEYTALQEIGMAFGRIVMCAFSALLLVVAPLSIALALSIFVAAFAAGIATALSYRTRIEAY